MPALNRLLGPHPAVIAFLLSGGAFLVLFFSYPLLISDSSTERAYWDHDFAAAWRWGLIVTGAMLWLAGGLGFGRRCGLRWFVALGLHLLPVIGLIFIRLIGKPLTAREAWARDNPGLDTKLADRSYRRVKPLY